jgi:hypothetical protein
MAACMAPTQAPTPSPQGSPRPATDWDLSWTQKLVPATDRAVFDWPSLGDADDPLVMELAARYLDNCAVAYAPGTYKTGLVMNIRTTAIPAAMTDALWARYSLGAEYKVKDSATQENATRNPFWSRGKPATPVAFTPPTLGELVDRGAIILVCDFAMGHLATRLAAKVGRSADDVHNDLRHGLVPGSFAVPSGIFGLARAQNAGCAFVRM